MTFPPTEFLDRRRSEGQSRKKMRTEGSHGGQRSEAMAANTRSFDRKDLSIERSGRSKERPLVQEERPLMEKWRTKAAIMVDR
jgi:hypothetical protein